MLTCTPFEVVTSTLVNTGGSEMVVWFCASVTVRNTGVDSVVSGLSVIVLVVTGERLDACAMTEALEPSPLGAKEVVEDGRDATGEVEPPEPPGATVPWTCGVRICCDEDGTGGLGSALILVERIETGDEGREAVDTAVREGATEVGVGGSDKGMETSEDDWVWPSETDGEKELELTPSSEAVGAAEPLSVLWLGIAI